VKDGRIAGQMSITQDHGHLATANNEPVAP
jgi:hypothetical protein